MKKLMTILMCLAVMVFVGKASFADDENDIMKRHQEWMKKVVLNTHLQDAKAKVKQVNQIETSKNRSGNPDKGESMTEGPITEMTTYLVMISRESDATKTFGSVEEAKAALEAATGFSVNLNPGGANGTDYAMGMTGGSAFFTYDTNEDGTVKLYLKNDVQPLGSREIKHIDWANYSWPGVEGPEVIQRKAVEAKIELKGNGKNYTISPQMADAPKEVIPIQKKQ